MTAAHETLFATLADPTRRAIFERLCRDGLTTVGALTEGAGVSQPVVSRHLSVLRQAGLVTGHPEGRQTRYAADPSKLAPLADWTRSMTDFWEARMDALSGLLDRMDQ
jgi:DNA-binding transcriptional ArsR family regulator